MDRRDERDYRREAQHNFDREDDQRRYIREEPPRQGGRFDNMDRWQPGMRSDYSPQQDWRRHEFGVGPEYGPDFAFRDFARADSIRDKWMNDLRNRQPDWDRQSWTSERYSEAQPPRRGRFTGVGPKGYTRSDERIREDVCDRLTQHPDIDASDVEVTVERGEVTLSGSVPDRLMKRWAEDSISDIIGVQDVNNRLRVRREEQSPTRDQAA